MAYIFGSLIGTAVGTVVSNELHNNRVRGATARRESPAGRLGFCGIASLRYFNSARKVLGQLFEASDANWYVMEGARLGGRDLPFVIFSDDWAVVVQPMVGSNYAGAVRCADEAAQALTAWTAPHPLPVSTVVCRADVAEEPREVPSPSGGLTTITGLPWLAGLLRRRIGPVLKRTAGPESLHEPFVAGGWRATHQWDLYWAALRRLPAQEWWVMAGLALDDDYREPIDLVLAGPNGVFVVELSMTGGGDCGARVVHNTQRLRGYLPNADVVPVVVTDTLTETRFGPKDTAGNPIAWLPQQDLLAFVWRTRRRGLGRHELGILNGPATGWYRRVVPGASGAPTVDFGWTSRPDRRDGAL